MLPAIGNDIRWFSARITGIVNALKALNLTDPNAVAIIGDLTSIAGDLYGIANTIWPPSDPQPKPLDKPLAEKVIGDIYLFLDFLDKLADIVSRFIPNPILSGAITVLGAILAIIKAIATLFGIMLPSPGAATPPARAPAYYALTLPLPIVTHRVRTPAETYSTQLTPEMARAILESPPEAVR